MNRFIYFLLCALVLWAPIPLGSNRPWAWSILQMLVGCAFLLHLAWVARQRAALVPEGKRALWLLVPLCLVQGWVWLQQLAGFTVDPGQTEIMLFRGVSYTLFAWLILIYVNSERRIRGMLQVLVVSGLLQAGFGALEILLNGSFGWLFEAPGNDRANASFVYANHLANYLAISISAALALLLTEMQTEAVHTHWRDRVRDFFEFLLSSKVVVRLSAIVMVIALIMTKSRMGNAGFFSALTVVGLYAFVFYRKKPVHFKTLIISIFILDLLIVGALFGVDKVKERLESTSFVSETRDEVVIDSLPLVDENLFTGTGAGSFYTVFPQKQPGVYHAFYDHAHNDYLQFFVEFGLPGFTLLGVMMLSVLWTAFTAMRGKGSRLRRGVGFGVALAIVHMGFHSFVDFSLQAPANTYAFLLMLSLMMLDDKIFQKRKVTRLSPLAA